MTTRRSLENRIDALDSDVSDLGDVLVIGGDPEKAGFLTWDEYDRLHGDSDSDRELFKTAIPIDGERD